MRNDHKGRLTFGNAQAADSFYASGESGKEIRANGNGGKLARGYYARCKDSGLLTGPHKTRAAAESAFLSASTGY